MYPSPTDKQIEAMGHIVADEIGSDMQTGYYGDGWFYAHTQSSPGARVKYHYIGPDGTILFDSPPPGVKNLGA